jgi:mitogen-activated protein kinase 1/3
MFLLSLVYNQALADPYFKGLAEVEREPSCQPITKVEFEFERTKVTKEGVKELILREILENHMNRTEKTNFIYPRYFFASDKNGA